MIKSAEEIRALERLARMTDAALAACRSEIRAGMTEREVAEQLERCCREAGGEEAAFRPIVASGPRAAMPHYRAASGRVRKGSCLLIDFGIQSGGYNSDLTRTFYWGRVTARFRAVYGAVAEAQQFALQIIKPGIRASAVDAGTRALIASRGFGSRFGHALGHGIGMEVHEAPRIGRESSDILEAGMVFSVEPGIYLPGWGGVRIEDMVLVTPGGCRTLTSFAKELGEIVL